MYNLNLFNTNANTAGFRLQYMEILNWGTFDNQVYAIQPLGNNSLLTGANASGKSTYIDALSTLMTPLQKDRFYNQSSGVEKKGDRSEESYVLGHYGNIHEEGKQATTIQKLRNNDTFSVLLANFSDNVESEFSKHITLFQVRWFANTELKRQFGIAHIPLNIEKDFKQLDAKGQWKKTLEKTYNQSTKRRNIEFFDGPVAYAERITQLLGMRSLNALRLFNQIVGVKVLDNLDDFIRTNMLEKQDAEKKFIELENTFDALIKAQNNIEKSKVQLEKLQPIIKAGDLLQQYEKDLPFQQSLKVSGEYWFCREGVALFSNELQQHQETLAYFEKQNSLFSEQEKDLTQKRVDIEADIKNNDIGLQIENSKKDIAQLERSKQERLQQLEKYNNLAKAMSVNESPQNDEAFQANLAQIKAVKQQAIATIDNDEQQLDSLKLSTAKITEKKDDVLTTLTQLNQQQSKITGQEATIRANLLALTHASKEEIPFAGELIQVQDKAWECSIEKALQNIALSLIVPEKYYSQINAYLLQHNLQGKIFIYQHMDNAYADNNINLAEKRPENQLLSKIQFKETSPYAPWLYQFLKQNLNFTCLENNEELPLYRAKALTKDGFIKYSESQCKKDDSFQPHQQDKFVLGWDYAEKRSFFIQQLQQLEKQEKANLTQEASLKKKINATYKTQENCNQLLNHFTHFAQIDWASYAQQIESLQQKIAALEKSSKYNEQMAILRHKADEIIFQLDECRKNIRQNDLNLDKTKGKIQQIQGRLQQYQHHLQQMPALEDSSIFEEHIAQFAQINIQNFEEIKHQVLTDIVQKINDLKAQKAQQLSNINVAINKFKYLPPELANQYSTWRADVVHLPEQYQRETIGEYYEYFHQLEKENLPAYEQQFQKYLQETIGHNIGDFNMFFTTWLGQIKENIDHLNQSLKAINFNPQQNTFIQLMTLERPNDEIKEFRKLLKDAIPNFLQINHSVDGRKHHFEQKIIPLIKKLKEKSWRDKVLDVRFWLNYKVEEFCREDKRKFKTYENMGQLSGGEKAQLTYTILGSAIAYQFGLTQEGLESHSFRFIAIDEAFKAQDEDKARYLIELCKQLHLQLLVVTPCDNIHVVEEDISFVHFVERQDGKCSIVINMPIQQFQAKKSELTA